MTQSFPFLSAYDPPGSSEGTLDPLGLYQIADQLAVQLVPAVRERMQRIRFLSAMAVGAVVTQEIEDDPRHRDASPHLVWEWLVVEALVRTMGDNPDVWGVPGTLVTRRALHHHQYLDARSYLKTPRIFGFFGVYKRLAIHLGLVDVHLRLGSNTERLVDAWARDIGFEGIGAARGKLAKWKRAVERSLAEDPPRTKTGWSKDQWKELAEAFSPSGGKRRERRLLKELLHMADERRLGALPTIWELQDGLDDSTYTEESLHTLLEKREPSYAPLLTAIRSYEAFARRLQDAFDLLKAEAARRDGVGFALPSIADDLEFKSSIHSLSELFFRAHEALGEVASVGSIVKNVFAERFTAFSEPLDPVECAHTLCSHHEKVQQGKSAEGKRPWFDRLARDRIYVRHAYRQPRRPIEPDRYLHEYRGWPIRRFFLDLSS